MALMPERVKYRKMQRGNRSGLVGTFVIGMVAGLVASPCVGPFLNALLLVIATTGDFDGILAEDVIHSRLILVWGTNPAVTNPNTGKVEEALSEVRHVKADLHSRESSVLGQLPGPADVSALVLLH